MMKKQMWIAGIMMLWIAACQSGPRNVEVVAEKFLDGKPKVVRLYQINGIDSLLLRETIYYQTGQKYMEGKFVNGKRDSIWTAWLRDGRIWSRGGYKNGLEDGPKVVYHENGQLFYEGQFRLGRKVGTWKFYSPDGELLQTIQYEPENFESGSIR